MNTGVNLNFIRFQGKLIVYICVKYKMLQFTACWKATNFYNHTMYMQCTLCVSVLGIQCNSKARFIFKFTSTIFMAVRRCLNMIRIKTQ